MEQYQNIPEKNTNLSQLVASDLARATICLPSAAKPATAYNWKTINKYISTKLDNQVLQRLYQKDPIDNYWTG